jgi:D-Tyr-tRNAtyr deacylase
MHTTEELISPAMAEKWLEKNLSNRVLRATTVALYARQMTAGQWLLTHQGICLDATGNLVDGQHRLSAVVKAGVAVWMMVSRMDTEHTARSLPLDLGVKRTFSDLLNLSAQEISTVRLIVELTLGGRTRPSMEDTAKLCKAVRHVFEHMDRHVMNATAPFRVGVALSIWMQPSRADKISKQASEFARSENMSQWWPSMEAFTKAVKSRPAGYWTSTFAGRKEYVIRWVMALLNPMHTSNRITNDEGQFKTIQRACNEIIAKARMSSAE